MVTAYCTAAQVKDLLTTGYSYDELGYASDALYVTAIEAMIAKAQKLIDGHCHRQFDSLSNTSETFDGGGQQHYFPAYNPIITVASLSNRGSQTDSWTALTSTDYYVYANYILLEDRFDSGYQNYKLSYTYGYAAIPGDITEACYQCVANMVRERRLNKRGTVTRIGDYSVQLPHQKALTDDIKDILRPYVRPIIATSLI